MIKVFLVQSVRRLYHQLAVWERLFPNLELVALAWLGTVATTVNQIGEG
jgi:hypothetical protein